MKKSILLVFLIFILPLVSSIQYACTNEVQIDRDSEEINEGSVKSLFNIPMGICGATENSVLHWLESKVYIDANVVTLPAINTSIYTNLLSSNDSMSYEALYSGVATLKIDSSTAELEVGE